MTNKTLDFIDGEFNPPINELLYYGLNKARLIEYKL